MNCRIEILNHKEVNSEYWTDLTENCRESTPFSLIQYNSLFNSNEVFYIAAADIPSGHYLAGISGRIKGKLPLLNTYYATILVEASVMVINNAFDERNELKNLIYEELISYSKRIRAARIFLNHWSREEDKNVLEKSGFRTEINPTFEISAPVSQQIIFENYNYRCRNTIRKAAGKNVQIKIFGEEIPLKCLEEIDLLSRSTFKRAHNKSHDTSMQLKSVRFYEALFKSMQGNYLLGIAYTDDSRAVSFAVVLFNNNRGIYYRGGSNLERNRLTGSSNLLIDSLIKHAISKNISMFDMGGVPHDPGKNHPAYGVYKFKESFGGVYTEYYSGTLICSPVRSMIFDKILNNRFLIRIYNLFRPVN